MITNALKLLAPHGPKRDQVIQSLEDILTNTTLLSMATVGRRAPRINSAFFFLSDGYALGFLSFAKACHIRNLATSPLAAVTIAETTQPWDGPLKGLQLLGGVEEAGPGGRKAFFYQYALRFPASRAYCAELMHSANANLPRPYFFRMRRFKLIDELRFGEETYVRGVIRREQKSK